MGVKKLPQCSTENGYSENRLKREVGAALSGRALCSMHAPLAHFPTPQNKQSSGKVLNVFYYMAETTD